MDRKTEEDVVMIRWNGGYQNKKIGRSKRMGTILYKNTRRRQKYREKKHKTGDCGELNLREPTRNMEKAEEEEYILRVIFHPILQCNTEKRRDVDPLTHREILVTFKRAYKQQ